MSRILEIDPARRIARVQPGVVLDHLRNAAEKHHLTFAPDPASHDRCTIGGMIGNNSCGVHSVMAGKTDENIEALEVVTYDGARLKVRPKSHSGFGCPILARSVREKWGFPAAKMNHVGTAALEACLANPRQGVESSGPEVSGRSALRAQQINDALKQIAATYADLIRQKFPHIPRRVSGYNLNYLLPENGFHIARALVGSEGTCATVLEATCRLVESPPQRVLLVVAYPDIFQCADHIPEIMAHHPIGLEGFDDLLVYYTRTKGTQSRRPRPAPRRRRLAHGRVRRPDHSRSRVASPRAHRSSKPQRESSEHAACYAGQQAKRIWEIREASLGVTSHVPGEPLNWEGWEDAAVAPEKLGALSPRPAQNDGRLPTTKARSTATSATPASTPASTSIFNRKPASPNSASSSKKPPTWSSATAAPSPANTATDKPAPNSSPKCSAPN